MHPAIRFISFILLVIGLATLNLSIFICAVIILGILCKRYCALKEVVFLTKRLKWLFLSLFILNLWFNTSEFTWLPELTGLIIAIKRITILVSIVIVAHLFVITTSTNTIIAVLNWWFCPLKKVGISTERLAIRLALVLDTLELAKEMPIKQNYDGHKLSYRWLEKMSDYTGHLFIQTFNCAESEPLRTLTIPKLQPPPIWQWFYPIFLILLIIFS